MQIVYYRNNIMTNISYPNQTAPIFHRKVMLVGIATAIFISLAWALAAAWLFGNRSVLKFAIVYISMIVPLAGVGGWLIAYAMIKKQCYGCFVAILAPVIQTYIATYAVEIAEGPRDQEFYAIIHVLIFMFIYFVVFMATLVSSSRSRNATS